MQINNIKQIFLLLCLLILIQSCYAITEEDKAAIRASVDEAYKYFYYDPEPQAYSRAKRYVKDKYFYKYLDCKNNCEVEWNKIRAKKSDFSFFTNAEAIEKEAKETYNACVVNNCEDIKQIQIQECYDYIEEYIATKNKTKRK